MLYVKPLSIRIVFCSLSKLLSSATHNATLMDFSVESLHAMERDMGSEILKLMKAVNVSSTSEINQNNLQRLNKGPLSSFLLSMVGLFEKNVELCKSAAVKCDQLKSEQIEIQKQIMKSQQDQLDSVQKTVKTEMKTWADVAKKNLTQSKVITTKTVKEAVRAVNEEEEKSRNLIIYGVKEGEEDKSEWGEEGLHGVVKSVHEAAVSDGSLPAVVDVYRLGDKAANKIRPIKVELKSSSDVDIILRGAHKMKQYSDLKSVYVSPDKTKEQRAIHSKLVLKMKEMIKKDSSKNYFIKDSKVNCVDKK